MQFCDHNDCILDGARDSTGQGHAVERIGVRRIKGSPYVTEGSVGCCPVDLFDFSTFATNHLQWHIWNNLAIARLVVVSLTTLQPVLEEVEVDEPWFYLSCYCSFYS